VSTEADLVFAQRAWLDRRERLLTVQQQKIVARSLTRLAAELDRVDWSSWTASSRVKTLELIFDVVNRMRGRQTVALRKALESISKRAWFDTAAYVRALDAKFGQPRGLAWETIEHWQTRWGPYETTRLRVYRRSFRRYGAAAVADIEVAIGQRVLLGRSWHDAREEVMAIVQDKVEGRMWMVDRILRTETASAYNTTTLQALYEEDEADDPMLKKLVAIFDNRTAPDSKRLHGQTRKLSEPFYDPTRGREFRAPPNRPNDREILVGWRESWGSASAFDQETRADASEPELEPAAA